MKINNSVKVALASAAMTALVAGASFADINPSANPVVTGSGPFTYTYAPVVALTQTVNTGDFFTFYDVNGLISNSETNSTGLFKATEKLTNGSIAVNGSTVIPNDSPSVLNVTYTYIGVNPIVGIPTALGTFSFQSIFGPATTLEAFAAVATSTVTGNKNGNVTQYMAPGTSTAVPEPASVIPFALGGLGLLGLIVRKTRRTNGAAA